jgi:hypothetical protein
VLCHLPLLPRLMLGCLRRKRQGPILRRLTCLKLPADSRLGLQE